MPLIDITLSCPLYSSFRVQQVLGMFDVPEQQRLQEHFAVELPGEDEPWQIGAIVGPTGSGKTAVARAAFGNALYAGADWPADRAVIDCFGDMPIRQITATLTAVGFSSPPAWIKPYAVLSNGEKFRCDLALSVASPVAWASSPCESPSHVQSLLPDSDTPQQNPHARFLLDNPASPALDPEYSNDVGRASPAEERDRRAVPALRECCPLRPGSNGGNRNIFEHGLEAHATGGTVAFDEFTSVVDRTVARIGSAALSRAIRRGLIDRRFVAVTCHNDILAWLQPDWVIDMATQTLTRRRVRRPKIQLNIRRADRGEWPLFRRHHYLSGDLHPAAQCFIGTIGRRPAVFTAVLPFPHPLRPGWREHRTVCLPDFQGVGLGSTMAAYIASLFVATGRPYFSRSGHPAVLAHRSRSPLWLMHSPPGMTSRIGRTGAGKTGMGETLSRDRFTAGFEYVGPARVEEARELGVMG